MSLAIKEVAKIIENEMKDRQFFSANDIRRKCPHLREGYIINALITLKKEEKIEKWSNRKWRWKNR